MELVQNNYRGLPDSYIGAVRGLVKTDEGLSVITARVRMRVSVLIHDGYEVTTRFASLAMSDVAGGKRLS